MAAKVKLSLVVLVVCSLVLCARLALAATDPELKQCRHQCKVQRQFGEEEKERCLQQCEEYHREKKERARERREGEGEEEERRRRRDDEWDVTADPEKRLRQCQKQCERQEGQQRSLCRFRCQQRYERESERGGEEEEEEKGRGGRHYRREEEEEEGDENPYVFGDEHFTSRVKTQHGRIDVLQRFVKEKKSELLRGIENYRIAILEANPQTLVAPSHWDADGVLFVAKGRGTVNMIREEKQESFNIECGDVIRVFAGTPVYIINRDENEKLFIVKFLRPINLPGKYEAFHVTGGENPESFYRAFSWELLEAALKTERRRLEQIFKQKQGMIVKASKEQIQAMSRREEGGGIWPLGSQGSSPFSLLHKGLVHSNNYGQLFVAKPEDHKQQLQDLDLAVTIANITRGSMIGPYYNSKATKISIVLDGEGYFEMACPHLGGGRRSEKGSRYKKVRSDLSRGRVFVVPAGHPVASVASRNNNLILLCFEVNAQGNVRYPLAGKNNIVNKIEREAKELGFGVKAGEVEQVFGNQNEELFFPGPREQQREGRAYA